MPGVNHAPIRLRLPVATTKQRVAAIDPAPAPALSKCCTVCPVTAWWKVRMALVGAEGSSRHGTATQVLAQDAPMLAMGGDGLPAGFGGLFQQRAMPSRRLLSRGSSTIPLERQQQHSAQGVAITRCISITAAPMFQGTACFSDHARWRHRHHIIAVAAAGTAAGGDAAAAASPPALEPACCPPLEPLNLARKRSQRPLATSSAKNSL